MDNVICKAPQRFINQSTCPAVVVTCSQFGYQRGIAKLEATLGFQTADEVKVPGGIKMLCDESLGRDMMIEWLEFLCKEHDAKTIVLVAHNRKCAAYAAEGHDLSDPKEEKKFHGEELKKAREIIMAHLEDVTVRLVFASAGEKNRPRVKFIEVS